MTMNKTLPAMLLALVFAPLAALAADKHSAEDIKKDVERHRAMAAAHEQAAKCLESGQKPEFCQTGLCSPPAGGLWS